MGKPSEERKAEIITTTLDLAAESGVKKVTAQAIADRIGIAQPTVFRHFKNRDLLFTATINWIADKMFRVIEKVLEQKESGAADKLAGLVRGQLKLVNTHKGAPRLIFSDRLHSDLPNLKKGAQAVIKRYVETVAQLIEAGREEGAFVGDQAAMLAAEQIISLVQGNILRWSLHDFAYNLEDQADVVTAGVMALAGAVPQKAE